MNMTIYTRGMSIINPLSNYSLMDVLDARDKIKKHKAAEQGKKIIERVNKVLMNCEEDVDPGWMALEEMTVNDYLYHENLVHLVEKGFRVWLVSYVFLDGISWAKKHYISWNLDSFDEIFKEMVTRLKASAKDSTFKELVVSC